MLHDAREKAAVAMSDWTARREELRKTEWELHQALVAAGRGALEALAEEGHRASAMDAARLLELASRLGRLATGLATDNTQVTGPDGNGIKVDIELALKKVYSLPATTVEARAIEPRRTRPELATPEQ